MSRRDDFGAAHDLQGVANGMVHQRGVSRQRFNVAALWLRAERESVHRAQGECHPLARLKRCAAPAGDCFRLPTQWLYSLRCREKSLSIAQRSPAEDIQRSAPRQGFWFLFFFTPLFKRTQSGMSSSTGLSSKGHA